MLDAWNPQPKGDKLEVPVTHIVPAAIMGSGLGANQVNSGDYDIQLFDEKMVEQYELESLRLGDLVAIIDADHSFGQNLPPGSSFSGRGDSYKLRYGRSWSRSYNFNDFIGRKNYSPNKSESKYCFSLNLRAYI